jgi:hypothetical protein
VRLRRCRPTAAEKTQTGIKTKRKAKRKNGRHQNSHDKWVALRTKMREVDIREEGLIRRLADFLRKVMPDYASEHQTQTEIQRSVTPAEIPSVVTPKRDSSDDDETNDGNVREFDKTSRFLDNQYGIRREGDTLMIGNSIVNVDESSDITINGKRFRG